jgi:hypothetical protein
MTGKQQQQQQMTDNNKEFLDQYFPEDKPLVKSLKKFLKLDHPLKNTIESQVRLTHKLIQTGKTPVRLTESNCRQIISPYVRWIQEKSATKIQSVIRMWLVSVEKKPDPIKVGDRLYPFYVEKGNITTVKNRAFIIKHDIKSSLVVYEYFDVVSTHRKDGRIYGKHVEEIWTKGLTEKLSYISVNVKYALKKHKDPINPFYYIKNFKK